MKFCDVIILIFLLLLAGLLYWGGFSLSQDKSHTKRLGYINHGSGYDLRYNFHPRWPGSYEIAVIGHFKKAKNIREKKDTSDLIYIDDVSVTKRDDLVATIPNVIHLEPDTESRRIKVVGFTADDKTKYDISLKLEGMLKNGIWIVATSDSDEYKNNLSSAMLLKALSYVLLFIGLMVIVQRIYAAARK
ncbi:MAG: hypothetical protein PVI97_06220 [Candidatus Thiodiazotropha sp.]|jgi:hypothetical protein